MIENNLMTQLKRIFHFEIKNYCWFALSDYEKELLKNVVYSWFVMKCPACSFRSLIGRQNSNKQANQMILSFDIALKPRNVHIFYFIWKGPCNKHSHYLMKIPSTNIPFTMRYEREKRKHFHFSHEVNRFEQTVEHLIAVWFRWLNFRFGLRKSVIFRIGKINDDSW